MNKIAIATCLFGFIALSSTAPASEQCLQLLANEFVKFKVPESVSAYVANLTSLLPVVGENEWDEAEFKKIESKVGYPGDDCFDYVQDVPLAVKAVLSQRSDCAEVINKTLYETRHDDDQELKQLRKDALADEILGPKVKANIACTQFEPYKEIVDLPPCIANIIARAEAVHVPEVLQQFVLESRNIRGIVNHETIQKYWSEEREKECAIYVETANEVRLIPSKEECPEDWDPETMSLNKLGRLANVAFKDETYAMVMNARWGCNALLDPEFGMEQAS